MNHSELTVGERVACAARRLCRTPETLSQRTGLPVNLILSIYADKCEDLSYLAYLAKPLGVSESWLYEGKKTRHSEHTAVISFLCDAKVECEKARGLDISGDSFAHDTLGIRLELLRKSLGMTALQVQKKTRILADTIKDFEQGISAPTDKQIYYLSNALNSTVEWIAEGEGKPFRKVVNEPNHVPDF